MKAKLKRVLIIAQSEPVEIVKNGTPVTFVISSKEYSKIEELKMELVKSSFSNIDKEDLVDDATFFNELDSGKYGLM